MNIPKSLLMAMALTVQVATAHAASIVDAPHNSVHGVSCTSCHSYSLWWRYSPSNQSLTPSSNEIVNAVCNHCHDGSQPGIPVQHAHSSTVIASAAHGTWESACIACHDPHFQGQLEWVDTQAHTFPSGLYVIKGSISGVAAGTVNGTTNLTYTNAPADNQNGDWTDRNRWGKKNDNQELDRGLILVVDTGRAENTYQVISANPSVITVKGSVLAADAGKSFGLLYGQMIKKEITTPAAGKRPVTFFDPDTLYNQGGFTDHEPSRQGICQVCHTNTSHWTQDGLHDDHNADMRCTNCHDRVQGFKPTLPGHAYLINTTPCTNCHQHGADDPMAIHGNLCQTCHTTPPQLRSDGALLPHVTRIGLDPAGTTLANGKTATACTYCHTAYFGGHTHNHTTSVAVNAATTPTTANCLGCHPATTSPFIGTGEVHSVSGCATCHDLTANGALLGSAATAIAPYGECVTCHVGYFANHDHGATGGNTDHAVTLGSDSYNGKPCSQCHNGSGGGLASWNAILAEHQGSCGFCHDSQRTTNVGAAYTSVADVILKADTAHPVHCLECHANHGNDHQTLYVSAYADAGQPLPAVLTTCTVNCHSAAFTTNASDPKVHDSCATCHATTATPVTLIGSAAGKRVPEDNPFNNCYSCHGADYFANHTLVDHAAKVTSTSDNTCERCHTGDTITSPLVHRGLCALCHDQGQGGVLISLAAGGPGSCTSCHGSNWLTIHTATTGSDHSQAVAMAQACSACHANSAGLASGMPTNPLDNTVHASCGSCHDNQGRLLSMATGHEGGADCQGCHGSFGQGVHTQADHGTRVTLSQACSFCHAGAEGTLTGISVSLANPRIHGACASCHGTTGALIGEATGKGANNSCESCHGLFAARHGNQDHAATVAMATDCSACHAGAQGTATGMTLAADGRRHAGCTSCHDLTGALTGSAVGNGAGADCHTCHGTFASRHGGVDHAASCAITPACAGCHAQAAGTGSGIPTSTSDNTVHDSCAQCHGTEGTLIGSATGHGAANTCSDCHAQAEQHQGAHFVQHNAATDRGQATNQACNACHGADGPDAGTTPLDAWSEILTMHGGGACTLCHGSNREVVDNQGNSQQPAITVASVITAATNPTTCLACHLDKEQPAAHGFDHISSGIISGLERCVSCHANPNLLTGVHGTLQCTTCHDKTTAPVVLKGSAIGHGKAAVAAAGVANTCGSCHGSQAADFFNHAPVDHVAQGLVVKTQNATCDSCHSAADTINDLRMHQGLCADCHLASPGGVGDGTLVGSAAGKLGGGSCTTCHPASWLAIHQGASPGIGHLTAVGMATECSSCHAGAAGSGTGMTVDPLDPKRHQGCASCHNTTGQLTGIAIGNLAPNSCNDCHGNFSSQHGNTDHATRVAMAVECSGCHSASGNTVDPNDPKVHDSCAQCHGSDGALTGSAANHAGGGNCTVCHGSFATIHAGQDHGLLVGLSTDCSGCHSGAQGTASGMPVARARQHTACASCHGTTGALVSIAMGNGGGAQCNSCHGSFAAKHATTDHSFRVGLTANCADCHSGTEGGLTGIPTSVIDNTLHDSCSQCHGATGTLSGLAAGKEGASGATPNSCTTCHGGFGDNHGAVNHTAMVGMQVNCAGCHTASGNTVIPGDAKAHQACTSCHLADGRLTGSAQGKDGATLGGSDGGGDCSTCHGAFADNHTAVDHGSRVAMATECSGCHTASGNTVDPNDPKVHDACASCHGDNGALTGSATGHAGGGSCSLCHGGFATIHASQDHGSLVAISLDCSGCHNGAQGHAGGMPVGGAKQHTACASCHGTTGALVSIATGNGGGAQCNSCHGAFAAKHATTDHSFRVTLTTDCADCHTGTEGGPSGIPLNGSNNKIHDACGQCHGATGTLSGSAAGKEGATAIAPNDCSTCHGLFSGNHGAVNHATTVAMHSNCTGCHTESGNTVIPGDAKAHHACASCHLANGRLTGAAQGKDGTTLGGSDGGGDCSTCHGAFADNHASVDHGSRVAMATECSGCHTATGNTVNPTDPKVHDACSSCHGDNGTLSGSAANHAGGGSCTLCHGGFATIHASQDHGSLVALSSDCSGCHNGAQGHVSGMPVGGAKQHLACASCHGTTGALVSIASGKGGGAQCNSCHGPFASKHATTDHSFRVALATDCADCHSGTQGSAAGIPLNGSNNTIHDSCSQCHGTTGTLTGAAAGKEGATAIAPNDCSTCHGAFSGNHGAVNHASMVSLPANCSGCHTASGNTVIPGDAKAHQGCASCHLANGRLTGAAQGKDGSTVGGQDGGGDCSSCHGTFADNHATVNHGSRVAMATECSGCHTASGNTVDPNDPKVHDACGVCHLDNGSLTGAAQGHAGGGNCTVCHGGFATIHAAEDHGSRVALSTDCSGCHTGAQGTLSGMPVGGAMKHTACASCHGTTGSLVSIAGGHGGGAQCNSCHGLFAATHATIDHSFRVALTSDCADCHTGTQGLVSGMPVNAADNKKHDACGQCHGATGTLSGAAFGKEGATSTTPNDCSTCHGAFSGNHASVNHDPMVSMADHCTGCHTATGNTVAPSDPRTHDACASCHDAAGRLVNQAASHDGGSLGGTDGGGDCTVCHGEYLPNHQSVSHDSRSIDYGSTLTCSSCHTSDATVLGYAGTGTLLTQDDVNSLHSRPTGDSCALCHYYDAATQANPDGLPLWSTVQTAIVNGTNGTTDATCMVCHGYNETPAGHWNQPPAFNPTTISKPEAIVNVAYAGQSITGAAVDPDGDAITYAKVSGPAWLTVAADGTLGGTPPSAGNNTFVVRATATGGSTDATLNIPVYLAVNPLDGWTNIYNGAPTASPVAAGSFTVSSGPNRLLLIAVVIELPAAGNPTVSATYGGTAVTQIALSPSLKNEHIWMGLLKESQIGSGAKALSVTYGGPITTYNAMHVKWASFMNVNQSSPIYGFTAQNVESNYISFGNPIYYALNGLTTVIAGNRGNPATATLTATPVFTPGPVTNGPTANGQTSQTFTTARHTASSNYPSTTQVWWVTGNGTFSALGVVSLRP